MGVAQQPFHWTGGTHRTSDQSIVGKVGKFIVCFRDVTLRGHAGLALLNAFAQQLGVTQVLDKELLV